MGIQGPSTISLTSRALYERWTYIDVLVETIKTESCRDTKTVEVRLSIEWNGDISALNLSYEVQNIRNFPGSFETALRSLGVQFSGSSTLVLSKTSQVESLEANIIEGPTFRATSD